MAEFMQSLPGYIIVVGVLLAIAGEIGEDIDRHHPVASMFLVLAVMGGIGYWALM